MYIRYKQLESRSESHNITAPKCIYKLCDKLWKASHKLFADSLNNSGVLKNFCSGDEFDISFGC